MKTIGRYSISGRLGRGAMSSVYKGLAPVTERTVAIKILQPRDSLFADLVGERQLRQMFIEEARIMGGISHNHVAKIIDCDEHEGFPFIVLEYFAHSIGALIGEAYQVEKPSRVISVRQTFDYLSQSLKGLERLHFAGIIHRDIKPFNLMITNDGRVKIIDFGLSRVRGEEKMALPGMQVGSPYYAAPEQEINPRKADERADLFSIGILAYRMLTGNLVNIRDTRIPAPSSLNPTLDKEWDAFLLKSINKDPEKRYLSARRMLLELNRIFSAWMDRSRKNCTFAPQDQAGPSIPPSVLRSQHNFIRHKDLIAAFDLDALMRPLSYTTHRYQFKDAHLLHCNDTGLLWQREGAGFTLTWDQAHDYITYLNAGKRYGIDTWRLPTVDEIFTILRPPTPTRDFCYDSYFSSDIHWIWSVDTCTRKKAWVADIIENYFQPLDKDGMASVCAVSSTINIISD